MTDLTELEKLEKRLGRLAGNLERVSRKVEGPLGGEDKIEAVRLDVAELTKMVADLTGEVLSGEQAAGKDQKVRSWFDLCAEDPQVVQDELDKLLTWMDQVLMQYPLTAAALPTCWAFHWWVVEELMWLRRAWFDAYHGKAASAAKTGEWHDRHLPGVTGRLHTAVGGCSPEQHKPTGHDDWTNPAGVRRAPLPSVIPTIVDAWTTRPYMTAPEPTDEQCDEGRRYAK